MIGGKNLTTEDRGGEGILGLEYFDFGLLYFFSESFDAEYKGKNTEKGEGEDLGP